MAQFVVRHVDDDVAARLKQRAKRHVANLRELFRYEKAGRLRVYQLRVLEDATELWVASGRPGRVGEPKRKVTFDDQEDMPVFLEDVERTLRIGGWRRLTR